MAHDHVKSLDPKTIQLGELGPRLMGIGLLLGLAGLGVAGYTALHFGGDDPGMLKDHFFHAYLVAFMFYLGITLGAIFFVMLHHLARAGWSVTVRRIAEGFAGNIWLMAILFIPVLRGMHHMYEWMDSSVTDPASKNYDKLIAGKSFFLSPTHYLAFFAAYFAIWIGLSTYFRNRSAQQDITGDPKLSLWMTRLAAPCMMLFAFSATGMWFHLLMSLNAHWFSTMWGVYLFAGSVLTFFSVLTLTCLYLQKMGKLKSVITKEHYHDLGKFAFAFTFFWGYVAFSQYMLIWYANLPEETQFYFPRELGRWLVVSIVLIFCHLLIPFAGLLSRHAKRGLSIFAFWAIWLLFAELLNLFWIVMPAMFSNKIPGWVAEGHQGAPKLPLPEALHSFLSNQDIYQPLSNYADKMDSINYAFTAAPMVITVSLVIGLGGLYLASTAFMLRGKPLLATRDPKLPEALAFENI